VKAFVLEDNPIDRKLWRALLQANGHEAITWNSAQGALEQIRRQRPDIVLLDLNLAGTDGLELVRAMRTRADTSDIPVLAVTAYPQRYTHTEVVAAGCSAMLMKPVDTRQIVHEMQLLCERKARGGSDGHPDHR
jgi:CheY-like chemotaxis protein